MAILTVWAQECSRRCRRPIRTLVLRRREAASKDAGQGSALSARNEAVEVAVSALALRIDRSSLRPTHRGPFGAPQGEDEDGRANSRTARAIRRTVLLAIFLFLPSLAFAHPHVWVTVRSRIEFNAAGKVAAIVHDWVFDEMYSSYATQGLAKPGELVKRETFQPLAQENAGGLADVGYFTTLKLDGKSAEFAPVTDYWMEERPDHLVQFHVKLNLKNPSDVGRFGSLFVADPEFFIDFEFDDKDAVVLDNAPKGCSVSLTHPQPLDSGDKQKLNESFFTNLTPGANFGFKMASRAILACP